MDHLHLNATVAELSRLARRRFADREALVFGDRRMTFAQMEAAVSQVIQALKAEGLKRGDGIAMLSTNRLEVVMVSGAAQAMGLRYTALHPLGGEDDHAFILEDAEIKALVVDDAAFAARGRALRARANRPMSVFSIGPTDFAIDISAEMARYAPAPIAIEAQPEDISGLPYTGGTTGRPKGVIHRQRTTVNMILLEIAAWEWPQEIRFLAATPVSHAAGALISPVHLKGGCFVMSAGFDSTKFLETIEKEKITATFLVPTMIYALLDNPRLKEFDLSSLQMCIYGAAPMSPTRLQEAIGVFGPIFCQLYAQTEAPQCVTYLAKSDHDPSRPERFASCGLPVPGVQVKLLDDDLNEVPQGEVGEICVRGPHVMEGYWKRPDETAATLRGDWLHTGDMARADAEGFLYIVDRKKDMIVSGGFNVYPREVEDCLSEHPCVSAAAVFGVPDEHWGEAVRAAVVMRPGMSVSEDELKDWVKQKKGAVLAPKAIEFRDALPLTAIGKLDKKALRAPFWAGRERQVS